MNRTDDEVITDEDVADLSAASDEPTNVTLSTLGSYRADRGDRPAGSHDHRRAADGQVNETLGRLAADRGPDARRRPEWSSRSAAAG